MDLPYSGEPGALLISHVTERFMQPIATLLSFYDRLESLWEGPSGHRLAGTLLVGTFLAALVAVEVKPLLPHTIHHLIPKNHLASIEIALTLLLVIEVMGLVFSMVHSVSTSVGRQLEILSLILLRNIFKEISHHHPLAWDALEKSMPDIGASVAGALAVFAALGLYYRLKKEATLAAHERDRTGFIAAKKCIGLGLFVAFHLIALRSLYGYVSGTPTPEAFEAIYTLLVLSNTLLVLLSLRYGHNYRVAFRNSAFAVVTLLILVALVAPPIWNAAVGASSALFALGTYWLFGFHSQKPSHPIRPVSRQASR
ncbi:MAG: hypothetical protein MI742_09710 [Desulfobacterales bacterium]|nr:hypothetical protein [Desulfobacterales bacterium]